MGAAQSGKTQLTRELTDDPSNANPGQRSLFVDAPPLTAALVAYQDFDFTLVCGLDLGVSALDGADPRTQASQDAALRAFLTGAKLPFAVIYGQGRDRLSAAQRALSALSKRSLRADQDPNPLTLWHSACENCSDPACERALFTGLLKTWPY